MATLTYEPFDTTRVTPDVGVKTTQFGDGYSQRNPKSINSVREVWELLWDTVSDSQAQAVVDFFDANKGLAFEWTPPGELTARKFVCFKYSRNYEYYTAAQTVNATITEVFE